MKQHVIIFSLLLVCLAGCPKKPDGFPDVYPCTVKVTKDGVALSKIFVQLNREGSQGAWSIMGQTDSSGIAKMKTTWADYTSPGVPTGTYKVILTEKFNIPDDGMTPETKMALEGKAYEEYKAKREAEQDRVRTIPKVLNLSSTTLLNLEVTVDQGGHLTVDVKDYADPQ